MSADYDRLFHSPDAVRTADEEPDRDIPPAGREFAVPPGGGPNNDATPPPMPAAASAYADRPGATILAARITPAR